MAFVSDPSVEGIPQTIFIILCFDEEGELVGAVKDTHDSDFFTRPNSKAYRGYMHNLTEFAEEHFSTAIEDLQLHASLEFGPDDYHIFNLPPPIVLVEDGDEEDGEGDDDRENHSDSSGRPGSVDRATETAQLRKQRKAQEHPNLDKADLLKKKMAALQITKTQKKSTRYFLDGGAGAANTNSRGNGPSNNAGGGQSGPAANNAAGGGAANHHSGGGRGGGGGGQPAGGGSGGPARGGGGNRNNNHGASGGGGGGGGGPGWGRNSSSSDTSDNDRRRRRKRRRKHKSKKRCYSETSDSGGSSSDDERPYKCKAAACRKRFRNKAERKVHLAECGLFYGDANPTPWGVAGSDMATYHIKYHQRKYAEFVDDSQNALHEARWLTYPSAHIQAAAAQPLIAKPVHHNYPWDVVGIPMGNRRLVCNLAYVTFLEFTLAMLTGKFCCTLQQLFLTFFRLQTRISKSQI